MGWLSGLLAAPISGPIKALIFICEKVQEQTDAEMLDESRVEDELVLLSLRHDLGEISEEEYLAEETTLLERLNAIRVYKESLHESEDTEGDDDE